jgi:hypothetical protein
VANWLRGLGLRLADHFVSGDNYNHDTGAWTATPGQYVSGIGSGLLNLLAPGLGTLAGKGFDRYYSNHPGSYGGIDHSTFPVNPTINGVGDFGTGYNPSVSNPFASGNGYDGFAPSSGDIFDPTGQFGHNDPFKNTGGPTGATQPGGLMGGKTWLTGQDAQDWVGGMQDHSLQNAQDTLAFWNGSTRRNT